MNRRDFLKITASVGMTSMFLGGCVFGEESLSEKQQKENQESAKQVNSSLDNNLVIAEGIDPAVLMDKGIKAMGGIGQFVKQGNIVTIKPNFSYTLGPAAAVTSNPGLVSALVRRCLQAGAKEVRVIDHTFGSGEGYLEMSGIGDAVSKAGGQAYNINEHKDYRLVQGHGEILKAVEYSRDALDADVFINMPILKQCKHTEITAGLKNLMGVVWDRGVFHETNLNQAIAELATYKKPTLTIIDAIRGIIDNGPSGPGTIKEWGQVIFTTDMLAGDSYGASLLGFKPIEVKHFVIADKLGVGELDWQKKNIMRV